MHPRAVNQNSGKSVCGLVPMAAHHKGLVPTAAAALSLGTTPLSLFLGI